MTNHVTGVPERVINTLHVEPLDGNHPLIVGGASCQLCRGQYRRGDWVRKLPCKHKVSMCEYMHGFIKRKVDHLRSEFDLIGIW